jgi:hypothetical protein
VTSGEKQLHPSDGPGSFAASATQGLNNENTTPAWAVGLPSSAVHVGEAAVAHELHHNCSILSEGATGVKQLTVLLLGAWMKP